MISSEKTIVSRVLAGTIFAAAFAVSPLAFAHGGGGGGGGGGMSGVHGDFGGSSAGHMSIEGKANTNGSNSADRDFGHERSADRHALNHGHRHHGNGKSREESHESAMAETHEHRP
jgi:hypothetical protein